MHDPGFSRPPHPMMLIFILTPPLLSMHACVWGEKLDADSVSGLMQLLVRERKGRGWEERPDRV